MSVVVGNLCWTSHSSNILNVTWCPQIFKKSHKIWNFSISLSKTCSSRVSVPHKIRKVTASLPWHGHYCWHYGFEAWSSFESPPHPKLTQGRNVPSKALWQEPLWRALSFPYGSWATPLCYGHSPPHGAGGMYGAAIKSTYCSYPQHLHGDLEHLQLQSGGSRALSGRYGLQTCEQCTYIHVSKTLRHIKQKWKMHLCAPRVPQCTCVPSVFSTLMAYAQLTILACIVFSVHDISPLFKRFTDAQSQYVLK